MKHFKKRVSGRKLTKREKLEVKKMIAQPVEVKYYNKVLTVQSILYSGNLYLISDVPQGIADNDRDGDQLNLTHINLKAEWNASSAATSFNLCRFIVFQWRPQTTPTLNLILTGLGAAIAPLAPYTRDTRSMYKILYDKMTVLSIANSNSVHAFNLRLRKGYNRRLQYQGGTTVGSNQIYILVVTDDGGAPSPQFSYYSQILYTDS